MIHYMTVCGIGQPWVAVELAEMTRYQIPVVLHAMRAPRESVFGSEWAQEINRATRTLYPVPKARLLTSLVKAPFLFRGRFFSALINALFGERESLRARCAGIAHLAIATDWARRLKSEDAKHIHAQWAHSAATIGMYGAWLTGTPFSFTGHAVDLFRDRVALRDKIRRADFIVCISEFHRKFYLEQGAREDQLHIVYCGIDPDEFLNTDRSARSTESPTRIVSVGRLVEKKGFDLLIDACKILRDQGVAFSCTIAGDGPLDKELQAQVSRLDLASCVEVTGKPILQEDLPRFLSDADIFAQPCVWSKDNDVDGTPRTLMEAMACGTPSISTVLAGIPDIVEDGVSGLLVTPGDVPALADAIKRLIVDRSFAEKIARGGRERIEDKFRVTECVLPLVELYRSRLNLSNATTHTSKTVAPEALAL